MPYVGFWHQPKTDAPYLCIEPWATLPGRDNTVEELSTLPDRICGAGRADLLQRLVDQGVVISACQRICPKCRLVFSLSAGMQIVPPL